MVIRKNERRKYPRKRVTCKALVSEYKPFLQKSDMKEAVMIDISLGGALFEIDEQLDTDGLIIMDIALIGWSYFVGRKYKVLSELTKITSLHVNGNIVRVEHVGEKHRYAVQFVNIKARDKDVLNEYIKQRDSFKFEF